MATDDNSNSKGEQKKVQLPTVFDRISDPVDFITNMGRSFCQSGMFGCKNVDQGRVLAMACLCEKKNPLEISRTYHIIDGKLSMKSDAMLAEFHRLGGKHKILQRDSDKAAVQLSIDGESHTFSFTWDEARKEPFVFDKHGQPKTNWATPRARMQMLWARVVSDGVRAMKSEIVAGYYTPEELNDEIIEVDFETVEPQNEEASQPEGFTEEEKMIDVQAEPVKRDEKAEEQGAEQPDETQQPEPITKADVPTDDIKMIDQAQLDEIQRLIKEMNMNKSLWEKILSKKGVSDPRELTFDQADQLIVNMMRQRDKKKAKQDMDENLK